MKQIVTINSGSSSIKFAAYQLDCTLKKSLSGHVKNIGISPELEMFDASGALIKKKLFPKNIAYRDFFDLLISGFADNQFNFTISAVGHRVVHGGAKYQASIVINTEVIEYLKTLIPFAPLHQFYNIEAIECITQAFPNLLQVACFDTAFHRHHPAVADRFALPRDLINAGVKRYGFHGLSYEYIMQQLKKMHPEEAQQRIIIAHLGNGASMCAVKEGKSIASTMGFTALDGLMMGTRCGNLDPGVILYLLQSKNMSPKEIENLLYKKSGLLGVSGISNNMQILLEDTSSHAREAIELYVYRIRHELGALTAALEGLEVLIFTGGIGENAAQIRERVCADFEWLGMVMNKEHNKKNATSIHDANSRIRIYVIPTNEEWMIAHHTYHLIHKDVRDGS